MSTLFLCKQTSGSIESAASFRANNCPGGMATTVMNADVVYTSSASSESRLYHANIPTVLKSQLSLVPSPEDLVPCHNALGDVPGVPGLIGGQFLVGFKFRNALSGPDQAKLATLGYTQRGSGGNGHWAGPMPSKEGLAAVLAMGPELDAHLPANVSHISGFVAYNSINALMHLIACACHADVDEVEITYPSGDDPLRLTAAAPRRMNKLYITSPETGKRGVFVRYFTGLTLPDLGSMSMLLSHFNSCLGSNAQEVLTTAASLLSGARGFVKLPAGQALTHAFYCVYLAQQLGATPRFVMPEGVYKGTVLHGKTFKFFQRGVTISPLKTGLKEALSKVLSHNQTLSEIASILSLVKIAKDDEKQVITAADIDTPRKLHVECQRRVLDTDTQASIGQKIPSLLYPDQKFLDPLLESNIVRLVKVISGVSSFGPEDPFPYRNAALLFTKDHLLSALAVFGVVVPTFRANGGEAFVLVNNGKTDELERVGNRQPLLKGIPLYHAPITAAANEWRELMKHHTITYRTTQSKNFSGTAKVFRQSSAKTLLTELKLYFGREDTRGEKRKRVDPVPAVGPSTKKVKQENQEIIRRLMGLTTITADADMDAESADEEDDDA